MVTVLHSRRLQHAALIALVLIVTLVAVACSDDSESPEPISGGADSSAACQELQQVRSDIDKARAAILRGDRADAEAAVDDARNNLRELRSALDSQPQNDAASQAAADLVGAVDGLQTTIRQAGQGGDSLLGVVQELETELPAIVSAMNSLRSELKCN